MPGVAGAGVAQDFAVDGRAASAGVLALLEHEHPGPFAQDEAVAIAAEGAAGAVGLVVPAPRDDAHHVEAHHDGRGDRGIGPAGQDQRALAVLDASQGVAEGVGAGGAAGRDDVRGAAQAELDRDLGGDVAVRARPGRPAPWPAPAGQHNSSRTAPRRTRCRRRRCPAAPRSAGGSRGRDPSGGRPASSRASRAARIARGTVRLTTRSCFGSIARVRSIPRIHARDAAPEARRVELLDPANPADARRGWPAGTTPGRVRWGSTPRFP